MKKNDDRVLFSPTEGKKQSKEFDIPFALSDKEKEIFPLPNLFWNKNSYEG